MKHLRKVENRDYSFDNLRAVLIFFVVFGHLLEICNPFPLGAALYRVIYSFHMPVFLFICGWFARFDRKKILLGLFVPYLMLQTAYVFFQRLLYRADVPLQFTTPYWLLWFLLALVFYYLLLPLYDLASPQKRLAAWVGVLLLSLAAGYDDTIGYNMTLSRFLVFQPWFLLGFYARKAHWKPLPLWGKAVIVLLIASAIPVLCLSPVTNGMLYGSFSYASQLLGAGTRFSLSLLALLWIVFFILVLRPLLKKRIPCITTLGQNTLPVFLLHGFVLKYIDAKHPDAASTIPLFLLLVCLILLLTGNTLTAAVFRRLLPEYWIKKLTKSRQSAQ